MSEIIGFYRKFDEKDKRALHFFIIGVVAFILFFLSVFWYQWSKNEKIAERNNTHALSELAENVSILKESMETLIFSEDETQINEAKARGYASCGIAEFCMGMLPVDKGAKKDFSVFVNAVENEIENYMTGNGNEQSFIKLGERVGEFSRSLFVIFEAGISGRSREVYESIEFLTQNLLKTLTEDFQSVSASGFVLENKFSDRVEISPVEAKKYAKEIIGDGIPLEVIRFDNARIPVYSVRCDNAYVEVSTSKKELVSMVIDRNIEEAVISEDRALEILRHRM